MQKIHLHNSQTIPLFLFILFTSMSFLVISQPPSSEESILLSIKKQWRNQPPLQSWDATTSFCRWSGIQCADDGTITGIFLANQNISGEIPPSICDLQNLTTLDLGNNFLGGEFPTLLYNCTKLQNLNLIQNLFVGQLPNDINNLSPNLQHLNLGYNNFTGDIPSSIGKLNCLLTLYLNSNLFDGTFPPELGKLANLEELVLAYNPFSPKKLPNEFGELKSVKLIWMTDCNLIGKIPECFGNLYSLEKLDMAQNSLEGSIPNGLLLLKNLQLLSLYGNMLSGQIPTLIEAQNLVKIDLSENNLTGTIPEGIASLPKLEVLNLFTNQFHGTISEGIGNFPKLEVLNLFTNQFHGTLPPSIGLIPALKTLDVWGNNFSGPLPSELGLHSRLEQFKVNDNYFTGQLPENLCLGGALLYVVADNNRLNGSIPKSLGKCNSLRVVGLQKNNLTGEIPEGLWSLDNLSNLRLSNNSFSGQLPRKLANNMTNIEMSNNKFFGEIPPSAGDWQHLVVFDASNNLLSGAIPLELTSLSRITSLSLDGNHLSGKLPSKIISWVKLKSLHLSSNELSGPIPSALGLLPVLTYLDLSNNQLSGKIPPALGNLSFSSLDLSSNKFIGRVPFEFDNYAYQTSFLNTDLCSITGDLDLPRCKFNREKTHNFPFKYLALIIVLALLSFLAIVYFIIFELQRRKHNQDTTLWKLTPFQTLDFTEDKILANINEANFIGSGGSGKVYRISVYGSWETVAAKKIQNKKMRDDKEFQTEVQVLGEIRHLNIVKLLCCISSENSKILVYEYMENQSLDKWIHKGKQRPVLSMVGSVQTVVLDWPTRSKIAIGAAKGLSYMHHGSSPPIIHRDVKSSNILLDSEFNPKIADFGFAKILAKPGGGIQTVSTVVGTFGYMAPEYCHSTKVNEKIDVYSFGVVLLELVTGKEANDGNEDLNLAQWAWQHYYEGHPIKDALDEEVKEDCYLEHMTTVFMLGIMCTNNLPLSRPSMKEVFLVLQKCNDLEGSRREEDGNESNSAPLLDSGSYVSSCRNSRKTIEDDYDDIV